MTLPFFQINTHTADIYCTGAGAMLYRTGSWNPTHNGLFKLHINITSKRVKTSEIPILFQHGYIFTYSRVT